MGGLSLFYGGVAFRLRERDFVRAWRTGEQPAMSLAKARRDLEHVEAAYASADR